MAEQKRRAEFKQRWSERAARITLAAIAAVVARAPAEDVSITILALVVLMAASEVVVDVFSYYRFRKRISDVDQEPARRRRIRSAQPGMVKRKRAARDGDRR